MAMYSKTQQSISCAAMEKERYIFNPTYKDNY